MPSELSVRIAEHVANETFPDIDHHIYGLRIAAIIDAELQGARDALEKLRGLAAAWVNAEAVAIECRDGISADMYDKRAQVAHYHFEACLTNALASLEVKP